MTRPETRYARSGDVHVAYQVHGAGATDLVFVPGFVSNLDQQWDDPGYARLLARLPLCPRHPLRQARHRPLRQTSPTFRRLSNAWTMSVQ